MAVFVDLLDLEYATNHGKDVSLFVGGKLIEPIA